MKQLRPMKQPNFDHVARLYRWAEYLTLGPLLQRTRTHFLAQLPAFNNALILGDGDGRFLAQLLAHQPTLQALAVDTSATMLQLLRRRCQPYADRLQTLQTSAMNLTPATIRLASSAPSASSASAALATIGYPKASALGLLSPLGKKGAGSPRPEPWVSPDLITTHFFLDCLTQPQVDALTQSLAAQISPGALWLLSDFGQPRPRALRPLAAIYIRFLYLAFRLLTGLRVTHLPDPQTSLSRAGFHRIARHDLLYGLLYAEIWEYR